MDIVVGVRSGKAGHICRQVTVTTVFPLSELNSP